MLNEFKVVANEAIPDLMDMVELLSATDRGSGNLVGLARTAAFIEAKLVALALLRYRIKTPQPVPALEALMAKIEGKTFIDGTKTTITYQKGAGFGPMARLPWVDTACQIVAAVSAEMGMPLKEVCCGGGDDAVSASTHCPTLDGLVPFAQGCHTRDERLYLSSIAPRLTLLSEVVRRFCSAKA